jgi:hypothetical protein
MLVEGANRVGHPDTSAVEADDPAEGRQAPKEASAVTPLHLVLNGEGAAHDDEQVRRAVAEDLKGDVGAIFRDGIFGPFGLRHRVTVLPLKPSRR